MAISMMPCNYPSIEAHAMAMLDATGDDLDWAVALCLVNCESAATDLDSLYWFQISEVLRTGGYHA